jgi:hypothetical protein
MRVTARGWTAVFTTAFLVGAFAPWHLLPWNAL